MLVKILGVFDLFVAIILFLMALNTYIWGWLILLLVIILSVKSLPFLLTFCLASIIDIIVALVLFLSLFFGISPIIFLIAALAIAQKGVMSLL